MLFEEAVILTLVLLFAFVIGMVVGVFLSDMYAGTLTKGDE